MSDFVIAEYDEFRAGMSTMKDECNFIPDTSTAEGYQKSKDVALKHKKSLTALEKKRKEKKKFYLDGGRAVDAQAKVIEAEMSGYIEPHLTAYKAIDTAKKEREAKRVAALEERVASIADLPELLRESSSEEVKHALESLQVEECTGFEEFEQAGLKARNASRKALAVMFGDKLKAEEDARELARLKKENEAREQKEREDKIREDAKRNAEREAQKVIDDNNARIEREALAKKQAEDKAEADRIAREADTEHKAKINNYILNELVSLCGLSSEDAKAVVRVIAQKKVDHISITY